MHGIRDFVLLQDVDDDWNGHLTEIILTLLFNEKPLKVEAAVMPLSKSELPAP